MVIWIIHGFTQFTTATYIFEAFSTPKKFAFMIVKTFVLRIMMSGVLVEILLTKSLQGLCVRTSFSLKGLDSFVPRFSTPRIVGVEK